MSSGLLFGPHFLVLTGEKQHFWSSAALPPALSGRSSTALDEMEVLLVETGRGHNLGGSHGFVWEMLSFRTCETSKRKC